MEHNNYAIYQPYFQLITGVHYRYKKITSIIDSSNQLSTTENMVEFGFNNQVLPTLFSANDQLELLPPLNIVTGKV